MKVELNPGSIRDYEMFLKIKSLPKYRIVGRVAEFPDEYSARLGLDRRFYGTEIKPEYHRAALKNLDRAVKARESRQSLVWDKQEALA